MLELRNVGFLRFLASKDQKIAFESIDWEFDVIAI